MSSTSDTSDLEGKLYISVDDGSPNKKRKTTADLTQKNKKKKINKKKPIWYNSETSEMSSSSGTDSNQSEEDQRLSGKPLAERVYELMKGRKRKRMRVCKPLTAKVLKPAKELKRRNKKYIKRLQKYKIPTEKLNNAVELLNSKEPAYLPIDHPKIYNLVKPQRNNRVMTSSIRLLQEAKTCIENRDYHHAVGIIRHLAHDSCKCDYYTALMRLLLVTLANDPIARQNDYLQQFLEGYYGIQKEYQEQFLVQISNLPQSIERTTQYDVTTRLVKTELKDRPVIDIVKTPLEIKGKVKTEVIEQQLNAIKIKEGDSEQKQQSSVFSKMGW